MDATPIVDLDMVSITFAAGIIVSLVFTFFPKLNTWFAAQEDRYKQTFMALVGLGLAFVLYALGCINIVQTNVPCTAPGAINILFMWGTWVAGNQGTDRTIAKPKAVRLAKGEV